jgi:hypothetical protein
MHELLRNAIDPLALSGRTISLDAIGRLIAEAPQSPADVANDAWRSASFCAQVLQEANAQAATPTQRHDVEVAATYWLKHFPSLNDRTRTSIVSTFTSVADILSHGIAWELLASGLTLVPEVTFDGKVILLDISTQEYGQLGRVVQGVWKYMFQKAVVRRDVTVHPRPIFIFADEAQNFLNRFDFEYQAVARSARACTCYLTQNISIYMAVLGSHGKAQADAVLGNFQTKIFHANGDFPTNQWAADTIGKNWDSRTGGGVNHGDGGSSRNSSWSMSLEYKVEPTVFTLLRKGGNANLRQVDSIVFQGGRMWNATGDNWLPVIFEQG